MPEKTKINVLCFSFFLKKGFQYKDRYSPSKFYLNHANLTKTTNY